jgi:hypothetical protein
MRLDPPALLAAALGLSTLAPNAPAQEPLRPREAAALRAMRAAQARWDTGLQRTSATRPVGGDPSYVREPAAAPPRAVARPNFYAEPHTYYSGMRSGQHPNANYISPGTLCVPGRRAFLYR